MVDVTEDSRALDPLLRLCYPVRKAELQHLDTIQPVLEAAIKYDTEWPAEVLTARFFECASQDPLRVWAFGCRHGLEHVTRRGAEALRASIPDNEREKLLFLPNIPHGLQALDGVSSAQYFRLLQFLRIGVGDETAASGSDSRASASALPGPTRSLWSSEVSALLTPPKVASTPVAVSVVSNLKAFKFLPFADARVQGWPGPLEDLPPPDIICRSEDGTEFKVHQIILLLYSPVLRAQIAAARGSSPLRRPSEGEVQSAALPVLNLGPGPSDVISMLLDICYQHLPQPSMRFGGRLLDCIELLAVATKYKIQPIIDFASAQWETLSDVPDHPHYCYLLGRNAAMRGAAAVSATAALRRPWKPEAWPSCCLERMEHVPAQAYHQLAVYFGASSRAAAQAVKKTTKAWETMAERSATTLGQPEAATRRYQGVTNWLNRRQEALERREVAPKADHVGGLRQSFYSGLSSLEKFDDDLEGLLRSLQLEVDVTVNKVSYDIHATPSF